VVSKIPQDGSIDDMAREKATLTLDRVKVRRAMALVGSPSMSDVVDVALGRLIAAEQLRQDIAAYSVTPLSEDEIVLGSLPVRLDLDDEDVDYDGLYGQQAWRRR
jgi:hypothetical protein